MVIINDQKFACQSCIKGHRSSACNHTDRPLFEIRKKGRPATQCDGCRDLRRLRRLHVKCACEGRRDPESEIGPVKIQPPTSGNRFGRKIPLIPKLPNGVRDIDTTGETSMQTPSVGSSHSRSVSLSDERLESPIDRTRPTRSCCSRKVASPSQSISHDNMEESPVESEATPLSATKSSLSSLGLDLLQPETPTQSHTTPVPPKTRSPSISYVSHGMDCLCGPACLCLGCTKHQQNLDDDDVDAVMHGGDCPPDCPSCIDNKCGAAWPASLSTSGSVLRRAAVPSSNWFTPTTTKHDFELDLDAEGEYDDEMDAEGSPDPEFCKLPEERVAPPHITLSTQMAKNTTKSCCAGKQQSSKLNNGTGERSLIDRGLRL